MRTKQNSKVNQAILEAPDLSAMAKTVVVCRSLARHLLNTDFHGTANIANEVAAKLEAIMDAGPVFDLTEHDEETGEPVATAKRETVGAAK